MLMEIKGKKSLEEALNGNPDVVLEFFATWCPHCKAMQPVMEQASEQMPQITFVQADVDQNDALDEAFGVESTPTFFYFKNGQPVLTEIGQMSAQQLQGFIAKGQAK